jgi:hypothetical protein
MIITNNTNQDLIFNVDSGGSIKGQQFRTAIRAQEHAEIMASQLFMLILNGYFQEAITNGNITVEYDAESYFAYIFITALILGWL